MKLESRAERLRTFRLRLMAMAAVSFLAFVAPVVAEAASCGQITTMREQLRNANSAIAAKQAADVAKNSQDFDAEEQGCLTEYMPETGLGLPGFGELIDGLKDAACDAANAYIGSQMDALNVSVTGPMGVGDIEMGAGEDKCAKITDPEKKKECEKNNSGFKVTESDIGVDYDSIFDKIEEDLPQAGNRFDKDFDYSGDKGLGDYELEQGRGRTRSSGSERSSNDFDYSAGGRR